MVSYYDILLQHPTGGRVTVLQTVLPTVGPGALESREDSNQRTSKVLEVTSIFVQNSHSEIFLKKKWNHDHTSCTEFVHENELKF